MRTNVEDVYAAGDCVVTHHRLLGESYLPLGTTALVTNLKNGRAAVVTIRDRGPYAKGRIIDLSLSGAAIAAEKRKQAEADADR